ncbi:hypothetical protein SEMRO_2240_G320280.1 [Seminavis robusta]|uniref:Uncharacterized protein n=1 Tax=Seminavis robusta TaxID=568900 RepID=A0A9N8EWE9_9STRA|nr:hypothetical protein SEMRO_2240_G320280.1 [Seminavis robusta]|eukprot:Sro2240_g320280.1 n/a (246) ;mRNA; r:10441-11178
MTTDLIAMMRTLPPEMRAQVYECIETPNSKMGKVMNHLARMRHEVTRIRNRMFAHAYPFMQQRNRVTSINIVEIQALIYDTEDVDCTSNDVCLELRQRYKKLLTDMAFNNMNYRVVYRSTVCVMLALDEVIFVNKNIMLIKSEIANQIGSPSVRVMMEEAANRENAAAAGVAAAVNTNEAPTIAGDDHSIPDEVEIAPDCGEFGTISDAEVLAVTKTEDDVPTPKRCPTLPDTNAPRKRPRSDEE